MTLRDFIKQNRAELDNAINGALYRHDGNGGRGMIAPIVTVNCHTICNQCIQRIN